LKWEGPGPEGVISAAGGLGLSQFLQETEKGNNPMNPVDPV
jgi:hypothetical protein